MRRHESLSRKHSQSTAKPTQNGRSNFKRTKSEPEIKQNEENRPKSPSKSIMSRVADFSKLATKLEDTEEILERKWEIVKDRPPTKGNPTYCQAAYRRPYCFVLNVEDEEVRAKRCECKPCVLLRIARAEKGPYDYDKAKTEDDWQEIAKTNGPDSEVVKPLRRTRKKQDSATNRPWRSDNATETSGSADKQPKYNYVIANRQKYEKDVKDKIDKGKREAKDKAKEIMNAVDVIIVFDGSGSVGPQGFEDERQFALGLIRESRKLTEKKKEYLVQYGVIEFGQLPVQILPLPGSDNHHYTQIKQTIQQMPYYMQATNILHSLLMAQNMFETQGRAKAGRVLVVMTDGEHNCPQLTYENQMKDTSQKLSDQSNINIIVVAIGQFNDAMMRQISDTILYTTKDMLHEDCYKTVTAISNAARAGHKTCDLTKLFEK